MSTRQARIGATFVMLADTLVRDFQVPDLLHQLAETCVDVLGVDAAGIHLATATRTGELRQLATSRPDGRLSALLDLLEDDGPALEVFRQGQALDVVDLTMPTPWPAVAEECRLAGYAALTSLPLRLRDEALGVFTLFRREPGPIAAEDHDVAQALADVATIGLVQARVLRESPR